MFHYGRALFFLLSGPGVQVVRVLYEFRVCLTGGGDGGEGFLCDTRLLLRGEDERVRRGRCEVGGGGHGAFHRHEPAEGVVRVRLRLGLRLRLRLGLRLQRGRLRYVGFGYDGLGGRCDFGSGVGEGCDFRGEWCLNFREIGRSSLGFLDDRGLVDRGDPGGRRGFENLVGGRGVHDVLCLDRLRNGYGYGLLYDVMSQHRLGEGILREHLFGTLSE